MENSILNFTDIRFYFLWNEKKIHFIDKIVHKENVSYEYKISWKANSHL